MVVETKLAVETISQNWINQCASSMESALARLKSYATIIKRRMPDEWCEINRAINNIESELEDIKMEAKKASGDDDVFRIVEQHAEMGEVNNAACLYVNSRERRLPTEAGDYETLRRLCD